MKAAQWIVLLVAALLAGCVTGPSVTLAAADSDAAAKQFTPPDGRANLYIARSESPVGKAASFEIVVDGRTVGPIGPGTFYLVVVDPGKHVIAAGTTLTSVRATLDAEAGKNYFYQVTSNGSGFTAQPSLGIVLLEEMGKIMVRQNRRAQGSAE